jgi:hypothetical protein
MIVLRPGDKVLVALVEDPSPEDAHQLAASLRKSFPRVEFVLVGGIAGLAVQAP